MDIPVDKLQSDFCDLLGFSQQHHRDYALILLAHVMVINFCRRRETLSTTLDDVEEVFAQVTELVRWNFVNVRNSPPGGDIKYHFCDPALDKPEGALN